VCARKHTTPHHTKTNENKTRTHQKHQPSNAKKSIAYIEEIPPGQSPVAFKLSVPLEQYNLGPLKVKGLKATGFPGKMLPGQVCARVRRVVCSVAVRA
jgi:hypothetical protein